MTPQLISNRRHSAVICQSQSSTPVELVRQICSLILRLFKQLGIFGYRSTYSKTMSEEVLEYDAIIQDGPKKVSMLFTVVLWSRPECVTSVSINVAVLWNVAPCSL
jgi:hypothetical protein